MVITGTPTFFDGQQGVKKLAPLAQRLATDFNEDGRFDNPRAPQLRLLPFQRENLIEVGRRVRDIFAAGCQDNDRITHHASDRLIQTLADRVGGALGNHTGIAPRIFLKKRVSDLLDRIDQFPEFDPERDYKLTLRMNELTEEERAQLPASSADEIKLDW